jgi:hypothetical protein
LLHIRGPIKLEDDRSNVFIKLNPSSIEAYFFHGIKVLLAMMKIDFKTVNDLTWIEKLKVLDIATHI